MKKERKRGKISSIKEIFCPIITILLVVALRALPLHAAIENVYTVYVGIDESINFEKLTAFEFSLIGQNINDVALSVKYQTDTITLQEEKKGAFPVPDPGEDDYWEVYKTVSSNGVAGYCKNFNTLRPLSDGLLVSLEGEESFGIDTNDAILASYFFPDGHYPDPYWMISQEISDGTGTLYTYTAVPVPIPSSLILLSIGLMGIFTFRFYYLQRV